MKNFFHSWRRKAGVLTLVMALVFMGCWIRCFYVEDWMFLKFGNRFYLLRSDRGGFSCNAGERDRPLQKGTPLRGSQPVPAMPIVILGSIPRDDFFVYYSAVAIPMTLLSAYLLIGKPRKRA